MIEERKQTDVAIEKDENKDTNTTMIKKITQGDVKIGEGPVLAYAPAVQRNLRKLLIQTAEEKKIKFQRAAKSRATGTDTDAFAYSNAGVPSALISLPMRQWCAYISWEEKLMPECLLL